jgi:hypothetical protein
MELSEQIAWFLHDNGFGMYDKDGVAGSIFLNTIPDQPDEAIGIFTTGGPGADPNGVYGRSAIQLLIRSIPNDPRAGESKAMAVVNSLHGFNSDFLAGGGSYIIDTTAQQTGANNIGADENNRVEYSQNFIFEYVK